jgi:hypothetical protein
MLEIIIAPPRFSDWSSFFLKLSQLFCFYRTCQAQNKKSVPLYKDDGLNNSCFCDPVWIRTKDLLLRRQLLYPAELQDPFKTEQFHNFFLYRKNDVGVARFELATSWSQTRRDNRATLHPDTLKNFCSLLKGLASRYSTHLKLVRYTGSIS